MIKFVKLKPKYRDIVTDFLELKKLISDEYLVDFCLCWNDTQSLLDMMDQENYGVLLRVLDGDVKRVCSLRDYLSEQFFETKLVIFTEKNEYYVLDIEQRDITLLVNFSNNDITNIKVSLYNSDDSVGQ